MELPIDEEARMSAPPSPKARTASGIATATRPTTRLGPFCRAAEACHLLGEVLGLVAESELSGQMNLTKSQRLDTSLQELAMSLLQEAINGWEECCGAIGLCLR
jgi:hypothetical protein